jgi:ribosome-dependent ATPase
MKQKLSLCGALIHDPDLLILDEPTTGVDPLSRRQFWELIARIRERRAGMSVIVATAYMEEAARFDWIAAMDGGRVIASGSPAAIIARSGAVDLEAAFIALLPHAAGDADPEIVIAPRVAHPGPPAIEAVGLTMRFGDFVAVDDVSFRIDAGEIFGFLGSNGCGKSTTMKALTGLLPASAGAVSVMGEPVDARDVESRRRIGYMSQAFSLYGELTVLQNLELHARLFDLGAAERGPRIAEMLDRFGLRDAAGAMPMTLPLGLRQRLQLAVAVLHRPKILILDEPTSGVDPIARDRFWQHLVDMARNDGVTIFLSTHFMNEAARCDRISLMHAGKVLAEGTPAAIIATRKAKTLEEAFIAHLEDAAATQEELAPTAELAPPESAATDAGRVRRRLFAVNRLVAYARREAVEILRDPLRLGFALIGPIILMITFGYGISFDVENLRYAVFDQDRSRESRQLLEAFEGSRYFARQPDLVAAEQIETVLRAGTASLAIEIPTGFGKGLLAGRVPEIGVWIDGAMPFRAETARGYVAGLAQHHLQDIQQRRSGVATPVLPIGIETRFRYNQSFQSIHAILPSVIMLMLILIPAVMTAVGVVREKETGSISNFRSTPITGLEFLMGKQVPYVAIALTSFATLLAVAYFMFEVPVKGSLTALCAGASAYILAATGFGLLVSTFTRTQVAAVFATAIIAIIPAVNFSGLLVPVSSLSGSGRALGLAFPAAWFQEISVGAFTKSLGWRELWPNHVVLLGFAVAFIGAAAIALRKQEP